MRKHLVIGQLNEYQFFSACITVYNRTVTNIEKTVRAVQSCNSWLCYYKITAEFCFGEHKVLLNSKQSQSNTDFSFTSVNIKFTIGMNFLFIFFKWGG